MKATELNKKLKKDRPLTTITVRMPEDVVQNLKRVAPTLGFSSEEALIRYYIGQGLRVDLEGLKRQGVPKLLIDKAIKETEQQAFLTLS